MNPFKGKFIAGNEQALMYEARVARRQALAARAAKCGLGSGSCCDACARGEECESANMSPINLGALKEAGALGDASGGADGVARANVDDDERGTPSKSGGEFMLNMIRDGVGEAADPAAGVGDCPWKANGSDNGTPQPLEGSPDGVGEVADGVGDCAAPSCLGNDVVPDGECPPGHALDPYCGGCIATSYGVIIDTWHHSGIPGTGAAPEVVDGFGAEAPDGLAASMIEYERRIGELPDAQPGVHGVPDGAAAMIEYGQGYRHPGMRGLPEGPPVIADGKGGYFYGLGAVSGLAALQNALSGLQGGQTGDAAAAFYASKQAGDTYLSEANGGQNGTSGTTNDYDAAVDAYKAAGQAAVSATGVGGELTTADSTNTTYTYTQQAFGINAQLNSSAINSTSSTGAAATQSDATRAQGFVIQMLGFYTKGAQAAIAANQQPAPTPPVTPTPGVTPAPMPAPPAAAPPAAASTSYAKPILWTAAIVGASIVGYAAYKRYGNPLKKMTGSRAKTRVPSGRTAHSARTVRA